MGGEDDKLFEQAMGQLGLVDGQEPDDAAWEAYATMLKGRTPSGDMRPNATPTGDLPNADAVRVSGTEDAREDRTFLEAMAELDEVERRPVGSSVQRQVALQRRGMQREIRRGTLKPDATLDLHGLTEEAAFDELRGFLSGAKSANHTWVLVVCGKGLHSERRAVLREAMPRWLKGPLSQMVLEAFEAPRRLGGGGAWVIVLRSPKKTLPRR